MDTRTLQSKLPVLAVVGIALAAGPDYAATNTDSYTTDGVTFSATITVPDAVEPDTDFDVEVLGEIVGGSSWDVHAYGVYEDAEWSYDDNHMVDVASGTVIDISGFGFGATYESIYTRNKPAGTYAYTFIFGLRSFAHGFVDVAVDIEATVGESLCETGWRPPLGDRAQAGRTFPLKFTAATCEPDGFFRDEEVIVEVEDADGTVVASWPFTDNPHTGVDIDADGEQYHVNWTTDGDMVGAYTVRALFSTGDVLERQITLESRGRARKLMLSEEGSGHRESSWGQVKQSVR